MKKIKLKSLAYVLIILMPIYLVRREILGLPTNLWEILASVWVLLYLLKNCQMIINKNFWKTHKKYFYFFGLIFLGFLLSTLVNKNYAAGLGIIKSWLIIPFVFSFLALEIFATEKEKILESLYFSAFGVAAISLVYFLLGNLTYDGRLQAFYNSPNYLAMYLAPAVIIGGQLWNKNTKIYGFSLPVIILALYFTYSWAAWAALLLPLALIKKGRGLKRLAVIFAIVIILAVSQLGSQKLKDAHNPNNRSSLVSRQIIWAAAGKMVADNWLWGIGPGNFQNKYLEYQKYFPPYLEWAVPHPHNLYLAFWLSGGIISFLGFLGLVVFWIKKKMADPADVISLISLGIILYFLIHGLIDTVYFKNDLAVVFWLAVFSGKSEIKG